MFKPPTLEIVVSFALGACWNSVQALTATIAGDIARSLFTRWEKTHPHALWRIEHFYQNHRGLKPSECEDGSCKQVN